MIVFALLIAAVSFIVSAAAGMGGSLIIVPTMVLLFGTHHGVVLSSLLLACNNIAKVTVYRKTIPIEKSLWILLLTMIGAGAGATLLRWASAHLIYVGVMISVAGSLILEKKSTMIDRSPVTVGRMFSTVLAFFAGATSGLTGTSGPLKGIAIRSLRLDRMHFVGAASLVSLGGDVTKSLVYVQSSLINATTWKIVLTALPLIPLASLLGRRINRELGERAYAVLFWTVMGGYTVRLLWLW
ncbi:MAG: sulfite exporter TauE/SafE family protein [Fuerstiella sp.]|nr:sulfite exporter TauE/SafE family protein [Fuerstiella sp.]